MRDLKETEIETSLVFVLTPEILIDDPRTETNAEVGADGYDASFQGDHPFLFLRRFDEKRWLLLPLSSVFSEKRGELNPDLKYGLLNQWKNTRSFFSPWQHWLVPVSAVMDACFNDVSDDSDRCYYATDSASDLHNLASPIVRNRTFFHRPKPRPIR